MKFEDSGLEGAWILHLEPHEDERGFFARAWCAEEFRAQGMRDRLAQCSLSFSRRRGTLRGMHFQAAPAEEAKVVRCVRGAIYDVLLDLRPGSPSRLKWIARELTPENRLSVYVPEGFAHGFMTLADDTEVLYMISAAHAPALVRGVRWDDAAFGITWPLSPTVMSERDRTYPDFQQ
jgi:dTDP-4-dehydrorhamnose 3,5-epimerase